MAIARELSAQGVTGVIDAAGFNFTDDLRRPVEALAQEGELDLRVFHMQWLPAQSPEAARRDTARLAELDTAPDGLVQIVGVGETLYRPLHDNPSRPFEPTTEDGEAAAGLLRELAANDLGLHLHVRTEAATLFFLDLFEEVAPGEAARLGWTLHHLETLTPETARRLAEVGARAAVHPRGARTAEIAGETSLRPPVGILEQAGVVWGLGTDATGGGRGVLDLMAWATGEGLPEGTAHTVGREAALRALTLNNARLAGRGDDLGSIEPGRLADLVALDRDVTDPAVTIADARPLLTVVGGRIVHRDGL